MIGYTVRNLLRSHDAVPANGQLYEATVKVDAIQGWATPMIPMFNARAQSGQNYRVLANVVTPDSLSGAAIAPGDNASGSIYFDVVGDDPNSVIYNDGNHDILGWLP